MLLAFFIASSSTSISPSRYGYTALMLAAQSGWFPVVERLLEEERIDLDKVARVVLHNVIVIIIYHHNTRRHDHHGAIALIREVNQFKCL